MKTDQIIKLVRRRIVEVDPATTVYTDTELLERVGDTLLIYKTQKVQGFTDISNPLTVTLQPPAITPEPADEVGVIMAYKTAADILRDEYQMRLKEGSLGVSWSSGLESESSSLAAKAYREHISDIDEEVSNMIMIQTPSSNARVQ